MKGILKAVLTKRQWEKVASLKRRLVSSFESLFISIIKRLPDRYLINLKSNVEIIKEMDYQRCKIFLNINSDIEYGIRLNSCKKEPETIEWIETFFKEGDVFYDIGANIGAYSLVASKFFNGSIKIYAFEPGFPTFVQLCKNIFINQCQEKITPLQIALSDKTTIDSFNYNNLTPGGALHAFGKPIDQKGNTFEPVFKQLLLSYRIDDFIEQFNIPLPNHIKIDVDGIELKILKGAEKTLSNPSLKSVFLEIDEGREEANQITKFLSDNGLEFHSKHKYVHGGDADLSSRFYNYIFRRKTHVHQNFL